MVSHDWSFLFQKIDRREGAGRGFAGIQTAGDPTGMFPLSRSLVARDSKPDESDSFRLTG
jgi:hypothetical protein